MLLLMLLKTAAMLLLFAVAAQALPPNVSLATVPVGYYGASWVSKTDAQIRARSFFFFLKAL